MDAGCLQGVRFRKGNGIITSFKGYWRMDVIKTIFNDENQLLLSKTVPKKTALLYEGDVSDYIYFVKKGLLRLWHNADGEDITLQFFAEKQIVSSFESFYLRKPSQYTLEAVETCEILALSRDNFEKIKNLNIQLMEALLDYVCERFIDYTNLFLSRIQLSPEERYRELACNHPEMLERIPHRYIASYLGITPVSLSRIRTKILTEKESH